MDFNRQVLEQVAKDGKTYVSLAKEMAKALLAQTAEDKSLDNFRAIFIPAGVSSPFKPDYKAELQAKEITVLFFSSVGETNEGGDTIYRVTTVKPGDLGK